ncbi:hypothetical protein Hanom_Chr07g00606281 [Helianthus anomalus]
MSNVGITIFVNASRHVGQMDFVVFVWMRWFILCEGIYRVEILTDVAWKVNFKR